MHTSGKNFNFAAPVFLDNIVVETRSVYLIEVNTHNSCISYKSWAFLPLMT